MHCPYLMVFDREMCVSGETVIIPSRTHRESFCESGSHLACPMKDSFSMLADTFSYSI